MPAPDPQIVTWLREHGHSQAEIDKIMARLAQYDQTMVRDALFDPRGTGQFNVQAIIDEVLKSRS